MSIWRQLTRGARAIVRASQADRELDEELRQYEDEAAAEYEGKGLSPDAARRAARLDVGSHLATREAVRESAWESVVMTVLRDLRYAARRLRRAPGFTIISALTLALGIGATTAIFSAVNPILFAPLPYPGASRVVSIWDARTETTPVAVTFGTFRELAERAHSFDALSAFKPWQPALTGDARAERLDGQRVSAGYFRALGIAPVLGRDFDARDDVVNGPNVAIITAGLWRRRFGGDPSVVGKAATLSGGLFTIVGVLPPGFDDVLAPTAEIYAPLQYDASLPSDGREWGHHLRMIGRVHDGLSIDTARNELIAIAAHPVVEFRRAPWAGLENGLIVNSLQRDVSRSVRPALLAIFGAVLLLLLIAVVNVTNLMLARGAERRGEFAMRAALGAGRSRIVRQLLIESLLLATVGGAAGVAVAAGGVRAVVALTPPGLPRAAAIGVDGAVLLFALAVTVTIGVVVGVVPAFQVSRDLVVGLREHSSRVTGGHRFVRRALVVAEVALAIVLLVGAGLLLRSMRHLFAIAPGFDPSQVLTMQVQIAATKYRGPDAASRFFAAALERVTAVPGVTAAAWTSQLPLSGDFDKYGAFFESSPNELRADDQSALRYAVTSRYFDVMHVPLRRGRLLDDRDAQPNVPVAVLLSESLARRAFPGGNAIGQHMHLGATNGPWFTVVGVVGDVKQASLAINEPDAVYVPAARWEYPDYVRSLVVRTRVDPSSLAASIKAAIWSLDPDEPIVRVAAYDDLVTRSEAQRRFALLLFEAFAVVAVTLAAIGIYGVLSGAVGERTREIGVRTALGASRGDVMGLIVGQGLALAVAGVGIGLAIAAVASRVIATLLFGVSPLDPATYAVVAVALIVIASVACLLPALRAARIDPIETLRV